MREARPCDNVRPLACAAVVVFAFAQAVGTAVDDEDVAARLGVGLCEIVAVVQRLGAAGEDDGAALVAEVEILARELQTLIFDGNGPLARFVFTRPVHAEVKHPRVLRIGWIAVCAGPFFRPGPDENVVIHLFGDGPGRCEHSQERQQHEPQNEPYPEWHGKIPPFFFHYIEFCRLCKRRIIKIHCSLLKMNASIL